MTRATIVNNIFAGKSQPFHIGFRDEDTDTCALTFAGNTMVSQGLSFALATEPGQPPPANGKKRLLVDASCNLFDPRGARQPFAVCFQQLQSAKWNNPKARIMPAGEAEDYFRLKVAWKEHRCVHAAGARVFGLLVGDSSQHGSWDQAQLSAWHKFLGTAPTGSIQGQIHFQSDNLSAKLDGTLAQVVPADFRLATGSAGKGRPRAAATSARMWTWSVPVQRMKHGS
jgi:hypothetical protein